MQGLCLFCGADAGPATGQLCADCRADLPTRPPELCPGCGAAPGGVCTRCFAPGAAFDECTAACIYRYPVSHAITQLKYQGRLEVISALAPLLLERIRALGAPLPQVLAPVPLHPARRRRRGFNQAGELARALARTLPVPVDERLLRRKRDTAPQYDLAPAQRKANVKDAFYLTKTMRYEDIAVVDDVITTGATGNELARLLKRGGAGRVRLWSLAQAVASGSN